MTIIRRLANRTLGMMIGFAVAQIIVWAAAPAPSEVIHSGSSLQDGADQEATIAQDIIWRVPPKETLVSFLSGATTVQAADQEAAECPCRHQILCCLDALRDWWLEHGDWPGADDEDEGGDSDEVLIRTETGTGDPTDIDQ